MLTSTNEREIEMGKEVFEKRIQFKFEKIDGFLNLEEATEQLVHVSKCIQNTHTFESARNTKQIIRHLFEMRKSSIIVLLDLIEKYIEQMPDSIEYYDETDCGDKND